jgi:hypothetical protein
LNVVFLQLAIPIPEIDIGSTRKECLQDFPARAKVADLLEQQGCFSFRPNSICNVRREITIPSISALPGTPTRHLSSDSSPVSSTVYLNDLDQSVVLLRPENVPRSRLRTLRNGHHVTVGSVLNIQSQRGKGRHAFQGRTNGRAGITRAKDYVAN